MPVKVKICGVQRPEDALLAQAAGADMIGMIFAPSSRLITAEQGRLIAQAVGSCAATDPNIKGPLIRKLDPTEFAKGSTNSPLEWFHEHAKLVEGAIGGQKAPRPLLVGVFQNQPLEDVLRIAEHVPLDIVQLHGDEQPEYIDQIPWPVVKVFHVSAGFDVDEELARMTEPGHHAFILLDTKVQGAAHQGGKGVSFDWTITKRITNKTGIPLMMAGGLKPENVAEAVGVGCPWGVDVSSGVESSVQPNSEGRRAKDEDKVKSFVSNAKQGLIC